MNNRIILATTSFLLFGTLLFTQDAKANFYPSYDGETPLKVGDCTLVDDKSEASATQVYTLNPTYVEQISGKYWTYFRRNARCDELQFHVDHNTPVRKLEKWLLKTVTNRIQSGYYNGNTVTTRSRHEWFWVENNVAHRIPDWLTGLSNGFLLSDRIILSEALSGLFYKHIPIGMPIAFGDGPYAEKITSSWKNGDRDYSTLPSRIADDIRYLTDVDPPYKSVFSSCTFVERNRLDAYGDFLDWSWMLRNPGCALASS